MQHEKEVAPVVPLHHIATLEHLSGEAREAVQQLQTEEGSIEIDDTMTEASALLEIATILVENRLFDAHKSLINRMIAVTANATRLSLQKQRSAKGKRGPQDPFWTAKRHRLLVAIHDKVVENSSSDKLKAPKFNELKDRRDVVKTFYQMEGYPMEECEKRDSRDRQAWAEQQIDKRLRRLLASRRSLELHQSLFGDLLGDLMPY
ncbi:hypothetical protein LVY75_12395 [Sinorhizobium sp. B11]